MKAREVELCQIQRWYPLFSSISLKTTILPLPEPFVSYLLQDGLFLPRSSEALPSRSRTRYSDDDYQHWDEEDEDHDEPCPPSFPQLEADVRESIRNLGGAVFPKLNWSAPKDSAWISSSGSLKCQNFGEIALLLKASDSLVHDLSHAFESCEDKPGDRPETFVLALRKWYDIRPEMEFRGFVRKGLLVGISQREVTGFYPALVETAESLEETIFRFFMENVSKFFELEDYTFDCYLTRNGRVKLVDFNPWGAFTLPLLFSWEELEDIYLRLALAVAEIEENIGKITEVGCRNKGLLREESEQGSSNYKPSGFSVEYVNDEIQTGSQSHTSGKTLSNVRLRERGYKAEFRIVKSDRHVQPNLRLGGGVPFDYVETGPGSAWDEFLRRAGEELQQQTRDTAAGG